MLSLGTVIGLAVIVGVHTVIASILIRFFRLRLDTRSGMIVFSLFLVPVVLAVSLLFFGQLPIFGEVDRQTVMLVTIHATVAWLCDRSVLDALARGGRTRTQELIEHERDGVLDPFDHDLGRASRINPNEPFGFALDEPLVVLLNAR